MPTPNHEALAFLLGRRSRPAKTLRPPYPDREQLWPLLRSGARTPDHGKLEPWRFLVLEQAALARLAAAVEPVGLRLGKSGEDIDKQRRQFSDAGLVVAVVASPRPSEKIPPVEQLLSAGAVCLSLLNAALAAGWGANWLTGWPVFDRHFVDQGLGLLASERVAGVIHIGSATSTPPDRPRPDVTALTTWATE